MRKESKFLFISVLLILTFTLQCITASAQTTQIPNEQINSVIDTYQMSFKNEDIDQIINCVAFPFNSYLDENPITSATRLKEILENIFAEHNLGIYELVDRQISVNGVNVTVICNEHVTTSEGDFWVPCTITLSKVGDEWKIAGFEYNK